MGESESTILALAQVLLAPGLIQRLNFDHLNGSGAGGGYYITGVLAFH